MHPSNYSVPVLVIRGYFAQASNLQNPDIYSRVTGNSVPGLVDLSWKALR